MMGLAWLWGKFKGGLAALGALLALAAVIFLRGRQAGVEKMEAEQRRARDALQQHYDEIDGRPLDPGDAYGKLRERSGRR